LPTQSTAERPLASLHILLSGAMPPGAKVLPNAILPETVPAAGVVFLRDGDPEPPEVWLSPPGYYFEHRAEIEVVVDGTPAAWDDHRHPARQTPERSVTLLAARLRLC